MFLANYGDVLTNAPINQIIERFRATDAVGSLLAIKPQDSFHVVHLDRDDKVEGFQSAADLPFWINGGFFVLRQGIFDYLEEGEDLVGDACEKAARKGLMNAVPYRGFWAPMDTLKERTYLEQLYHSGTGPVDAVEAPGARRPPRGAVDPGQPPSGAGDVIPLGLPGGPLQVLCLAAHPDDLEIGCGGTLLALCAAREVTVHSVVLTGSPERVREAEEEAHRLFLEGAAELHLETHKFPDGSLPARWGEVKACLEDVATRVRPDVILRRRGSTTHTRTTACWPSW